MWEHQIAVAAYAAVKVLLASSRIVVHKPATSCSSGAKNAKKHTRGHNRRVLSEKPNQAIRGVTLSC